MRFFGRATLLSILAFGCVGLLAAGGTDDLRKEIDELRRQLNNDSPETTIRAVDAMSECHTCKTDAGSNVTTKSGKLEIGGLLQIWDVTYMQDRRDIYSDADGNGSYTADGGAVLDNSGTRIRRSELKFTMNLNDCISAVVMIDPARENISDAPLPSNQGLFKSMPANIAIKNGTDINDTVVGRVQTGAGRAGRLLQDAYINFHDLIPCHDITVGQFKPPAGEEGVRSSANLDFCERAMVTQLNDLRDQGVQLHGSFWNDCDTKIGRFQYWLGAFNGPGNFFNTAGQSNVYGDFQNRSDDNDDKDFAGKLMVRPIWGDCLLGRLELGVWGQYGIHGESGDGSVDGSAPVIGLNRLKTQAHRVGAWALYKPMGCLRGLWLRGEYGEQRDRPTPLSVNGFGIGSGPNGEQAAPNPFKRRGWYGAFGYKLTDSIFAERLGRGGFFNRLMEPVEFAFRYESFDNIIVEDNAYPDARSDVYNTKVFTAGVNYYVWAYKHRIQVNYLNVRESMNESVHPGLRNVRNDAFIMSYQIAF